MSSYEAIHGRMGEKSWMVDELMKQGINFNDLKPGRVRDSPDDFSIEGRAETWMMERGISVEDLKKGTFYSYLEEGRNVEGKRVSKEEAAEIINRYNDYNKKRWHDRITNNFSNYNNNCTLEELQQYMREHGLKGGEGEETTPIIPRVDVVGPIACEPPGDDFFLKYMNPFKIGEEDELDSDGRPVIPADVRAYAVIPDDVPAYVAEEEEEEEEEEESCDRSSIKRSKIKHHEEGKNVIISAN